MAHADQDPRQRTITIHIDQQTYKVNVNAITGTGLRELSDPDIGPDRDLYLEVQGPGEDDLIELDETVKLRNGMHFFTAPASITPGHAA